MTDAHATPDRAAIERAVRALFAKPPHPDAYRVGAMWFRDVGGEQIGMVGCGPSEDEIVEAIRHA